MILESYWIASSIPSLSFSLFSHTLIPTLEPVVAGLTITGYFNLLTFLITASESSL